jgi:DNA-binding transcriptional LysR family regulator
MDTANLQAFVAIADCGSFSQAAERLFITQPAVSKRLRQLEQSLDSRLIDRQGKRIHLTQSGRALLPRARQILKELDSMKQQIAELEGRASGSLSMATSHHIGLHRLPPVLRAFRETYPEVSLDLHFMDSELACARVEQGELEIAVVTLPFRHSERLEYLPIWDDPLRLVCAPEHPLARRPKVAMDELTGYPAVLPAHGTFTREAIEQALESIRERLVIDLETNYLETIKMMVSVGLGWSILPASMIDDSLHAPPLDGFAARRRLGVVRHRQHRPSRAVSALVELLQRNADWQAR